MPGPHPHISCRSWSGPRPGHENLRALASRGSHSPPCPRGCGRAGCRPPHPAALRRARPQTAPCPPRVASVRRHPGSFPAQRVSHWHVPHRRTLFCPVYCWVSAPRTVSGAGQEGVRIKRGAFQGRLLDGPGRAGPSGVSGRLRKAAGCERKPGVPQGVREVSGRAWAPTCVTLEPVLSPASRRPAHGEVGRLPPASQLGRRLCRPRARRPPPTPSTVTGAPGVQ